MSAELDTVMRDLDRLVDYIGNDGPKLVQLSKAQSKALRTSAAGLRGVRVAGAEAYYRGLTFILRSP